MDTKMDVRIFPIVFLLLISCLQIFALTSFSSVPKVLTRLNKSNVDLIYGGLHHAGIIVSDTLKSKSFYMDVFGFSDDTHLRPKSLPVRFSID